MDCGIGRCLCPERNNAEDERRICILLSGEEADMNLGNESFEIEMRWEETWHCDLVALEKTETKYRRRMWRRFQIFFGTIDGNVDEIQRTRKSITWLQDRSWK
jgi:hypothetical protein